MVDLAPAPPAPPPRRQDRRRRRRRGRVAVAIVVVLALAAGALLLTGTLSAGSDAQDRSPRAIASQRSDDGDPPAADRVERRPLTPVDPLRLWIAGDSLAGSLGPSLGELTGATGVVQPQYDSRVSSGLMNDSFFDWPEHAAEQLDDLDPEAVVFIIGTNDANAWSDNQAGEYAQRTEAMMRLLAGNGRDVFWVNAPVMKSSDLEENVLVVDEIQRQAAARVPGVTYVDAHARFADSDGDYQSSIIDITGERVSLRAGDGIHFSPEGGDYLAEAVYAALDAHWRITEQRVEGQAKVTRVTKGSTQVGGTYREPGTGSSGSSSGSRSTTYRTTTTTRAASTPTTTSPPATTPTTSPPATTPTTTSPPTTTPTSTPPAT
jgi:hypothetical protein